MVKSIECTSCGNKYFSDEDKCPYCGSIIPEKQVTPPIRQDNNIVPTYQQHDQQGYRQPSNESNISCFILVLLIIVFWPAAIVYVIIKSAK